MERRLSQRFELMQRCVVRCGSVEIQSVTKNFGRGGALVVCDANDYWNGVAPGDRATVEVPLRTVPGVWRRSLMCKGTVARVEMNGLGLRAIAFRFDSVSVVDSKPSIREPALVM
jgi:hypothetical protein